MQVMMNTSAGDILIKLYNEEAPKTVENFLKLVEMGHYDGLHFHRVIQDFMIQGGCPHSKDPSSRRAGTGGPGWQIPCEASALALKHDSPGILSMANAGRNTGGSQFFLTTVATPWLNGNHAVFGEVVGGMDVVKNIENCRKLPGDKPAEPQQIISCKVVA
jgi:cyclophilin family peptidyl-prolyl cis-trans isomerase